MISAIIRYALVAIVISAVSMLGLGVKDTAHAASGAESGPYVTVDLVEHAKSLKEILGQLTRQTGYKIEIPTAWDSLQVQGRFINIPIENFFRRITRGQSISVIIDEKRKGIVVRSYQQNSGRGMYGGAVTSQDGLSGPDASVDPETGISREQLADMQAEQLAEMERYRNDPDSIDPETGVTYHELRELQEKQLTQLAAERKNPDAVDPETGLFNGELKNLQDAQVMALEKNKKNPAAIEPQTGMSRAALKQMQKRQLAELAELRKNPAYIDPETGLPVGQLEKIRKQQLAEMKL